MSRERPVADQNISLRQALEAQTHAALVGIAANWALLFQGTPPHRLLVDRLSAVLLDRVRLSARLRRWGKLVDPAITALIERGPIPRAAFEKEFGKPTLATTSYFGPNYALAAGRILTSWGIALFMPAGKGGEQLVLPDDLAALIRAVRAAPPHTLLPLVAAPPPSQTVEKADGILPYLAVTLGYVLTHGIQMTKAQDIHRGYLARLADHIYGKEKREADQYPGPPPMFLLALLLNSGLIELKAPPTVRLTKRGHDFLAADRLAQMKQVFATWMTLPIDVPQPGMGSSFDYLAPIILREMASPLQSGIVQGLRGLPAGRWLRLDSPALAAIGPDIHGDRSIALAASLATLPGTAGEQKFDAYVDGFVRGLLTGPFVDMGLVRLRPGNPTDVDPLIALTPLGSWLISNAEEPPSLRPPAMTMVQPNFEIVVPPDASLQTIVDVDMLSELVRRDVASTYRLTKGALGAAFARGMALDAVIERLTAASGVPLPANVLHSLNDWASAYGRVRVLRHSIVVTDSAVLLAELRSSRKLRNLVGDQISDRVAVVPTGQEETLLKRLRDMGHLPLNDPSIEEEAGTRRPLPQRVPTGPDLTLDDYRAITIALQFFLLTASLEEGLPSDIYGLMDQIEQTHDVIFQSLPQKERRELDALYAVMEHSFDADDEDEFPEVVVPGNETIAPPFQLLPFFSDKEATEHDRGRDE